MHHKTTILKISKIAPQNELSEFATKETFWGNFPMKRQDEISPRPAGTDLRVRLRVEVKFRPDKAGQFSIWHLFRFVYNFFEFFFVTMSVYETENAWISIDFNFFLLELFRFLFIK